MSPEIAPYTRSNVQAGNPIFTALTSLTSIGAHFTLACVEAYSVLQLCIQFPIFIMADASEPIVKCGIGRKSSRAGGESCKWKRRWFVLRQGSLSYFKSNRHDKPLCVIPMRALNACVTTGNSSLIYRVGSRELHVNMADTSDACEWAHAVRECQKIECSRLQQQSCVQLFIFSLVSQSHHRCAGNKAPSKRSGFPFY